MRRLILRFIPALAVLLLATSVPAPAFAAPTCFGKRATIIGTPGPDKIRAGSANDVIVTFGGRDDIDGGAGRDRICAGRGSDSIHGARGHDLIKGGRHGDVIHPRRGRDRAFGNLGNDQLAGDDAHNDLLHGGFGVDGVSYHFSDRAWIDLRRDLARWNGRDTLTSIENAQGTRGDDVVRGDGGPNRLGGGRRGKDVMVGRGGDDLLAPGDPLPDRHLRVYGGSGYDLVSFDATRRIEVDLATGRAWLGDRDYRGHGTAELHSIESVMGSEGRDLIRGNDADNRLYGIRGNDVLIGRGGDDLVFGGDADDTLIGDAGSDVLDGGRGQDFVAFSDGVIDVVVDLVLGVVTSSHGEDDVISIEGAYGTAASDDLRGNDEANVFFGLGGDDFLQGAGGADWLDGGEGADEADGGADEDTCIGIETPTNCEHLEP